MITTHLVLFSFLDGATEAAAPDGFDGIVPVGFFALELGYTEAAVGDTAGTRRQRQIKALTRSRRPKGRCRR
jgi:hypothetical protein